MVEGGHIQEDFLCLRIFRPTRLRLLSGLHLSVFTGVFLFLNLSDSLHLLFGFVLPQGLRRRRDADAFAHVSISHDSLLIPLASSRRFLSVSSGGIIIVPLLHTLSRCFVRVLFARPCRCAVLNWLPCFHSLCLPLSTRHFP